MYRNKDVVFDLQKMHVAHTKDTHLRYKYLGIHKQSLSLSPKHFFQNPVSELSVENKHTLKEHAIS